MEALFSGCKSLKNIDLSNFKSEKVENIINMFKGCESLENINLSNFNA